MKEGYVTSLVTKRFLVCSVKTFCSEVCWKQKKALSYLCHIGKLCYAERRANYHWFLITNHPVLAGTQLRLRSVLVV